MIVFVTGASAGFGAAIARRFAKEGHRIIVTGRRRERLEILAGELGRDKILPLVFDVRDRQAVERAFQELPAPFANIDVLVNNAGLALGLEPAQKANLDDWDAMVDTNVKGLTYVTRAALPGMVARDRGLIVNLGSTAAQYPYPGGNVYGATKAFVHQFSLEPARRPARHPRARDRHSAGPRRRQRIFDGPIPRRCGPRGQAL